MSKFTPTTTRNGACEICGDESGKCRRHEDIHLCMTFGDAKYGEIQNGYKCLKPDTKSKGWATFKLDNTQEWTQEQRQQWHTQRQQRQQQIAIAAEAKRQRSIAAVERDRLYRQLLAELPPLHADDAADLKRRGFTNAQIEQIGFRSIERYQQLQSQYPTLLPGIHHNGRSLINTQAGYICPVRNSDGLIVAMQIRLRVLPAGDKNRYRWLSASTQGHVLNCFPTGCEGAGELPLAICRPPSQPIGIALAEGTGAKPNLTALWWHYFVIGAAGGNWLGSPTLFKAALEQAVIECGGDRTVTIFPDGRDVQNRPVMSRWQRLIAVLAKWGYTVRVGWWGQFAKADPDIDELTPTQFAQVRYLKPAEFLAIGTEQGGLEAEGTAPEPNEPRCGATWDLWRRSRHFSADHSSSQPFFTAAIPDSGTATGIRSGTGTGKTQWLVRQLIRDLTNQGFLSIGYRNSLLIQFAEETALTGNWYHLQQDLKGSPDLQLIRDPQSRILCCIDSLTYFDPQDFEGKVIILDEVESIVNQLLKSDTAVSFQRERIKDLFGEMLRRCDRVIFLDGHLRDATVDYLRSLAGERKTFIRYHNGYQGNKGKVELLEGVESARGLKLNDRSPVMQAILNHQGCFVAGSDSQEELQALERKLVESGRKTLRFDGTTANKPWAKEFLKDPATFIRNQGIEVLLYSPSAEAGLSIDLKGYFADAYFIFFGVVTTNAQLQMLARVRDPQMEIHIACPTQGLPSESVSKSALPDVLANEVKQYVIDCATASLSGLTIEEIALRLAEQLVTLSADAHFEHEMFLTAIENHERANLRDCLREALVESGYQVRSVIGQSSPASVETIQGKRAEIRQEKSELTVAATDISTQEADRKSRSFEATEEDKYAISRRRLLDRLPGIEGATYQAPIVQLPAATATDAQIEPVTIKMVEKPVFDAAFVQKVRFENRRLISQLELRWLIEHPQIAQQLQQQRWHKRLCIFTDPDEPDSSKRINLSTYHSRWLKIHRLLELGIRYFLQPGTTWHAQTPEAITFWQAAKHPRNAKAIGRSVGRSSVCTYIGEVLRSIGLKTDSTYCHTRKTYIYQLDEQAKTEPMISAIYAAVERRFVEMIGDDTALDWEKVTQAFEAIQTQSQSAVEARSPAANLFKESQTGDQAPLSLLDSPSEAVLPSPADAALAAAQCPDRAIEAQLPATLDTPENIVDIAQMLENATTPEEVQAMRSLVGMTQAVWKAVSQRLKAANREQFERVKQWARQLKRSGQFASSRA